MMIITWKSLAEKQVTSIPRLQGKRVWGGGGLLIPQNYLPGVNEASLIS